MSSYNSSGVTLVCVDPSLPSSLEGMVKRHRLYKWLICHLGVIFFVYGPIFFLKKVLKTLADFATHGHVSKEQIFFSFFEKIKNAFYPWFSHFFPDKFLIWVKKNSFFIFWYFSILKPCYQALRSAIEKSHSQNRKKDHAFFLKKCRGGDIHPLWQIKMMHEGGISPPYLT